MCSRPIARLFRQGHDLGRIVLAVALTVIFVAPAAGFDLSSPTGNYRLNLDTTLSWGARYRMQDRDKSIISPFEGGTAFSVNADDGNLNFDKGSFTSNAVKATLDIDFGYLGWEKHSAGFFVRGSAFYDFELENDCCERTLLTDEALDWAGSRAELLDAYGWWRFPLGQGRGELRGGRQVLNWGESTFIQGGLSVINSVDVSALRVPGAELREAFRPHGMVWGSADVSPNVSLEGFYQYEWEETVIDPPGTFFSTNDFVGRGGQYVFLGFASFPDTGESPFFIQPPADHPFFSVPRGSTQEAENGGQYGLALRWFMPTWGGTELGFYFMNIHSRLPTINGISGSQQGAGQGQAAAQSAAGVVYATFGVPPGADPTVDAIAAQAGQAAFIDAFAQTARWFTAYPEDIKLYGLSWNAQIGTTGIAFQGEFSYRQDQPYQVDDVELLFAALSPINPVFAAQNQVVPGGVGFSTEIDGFRRLDSSQLQFTLTKIFSNLIGANQGALLLEMGFNNVYDMPSKDELRFEGPGTFTSGNPYMSTNNPGAAHPGKAYETADHFADDFSWGYRLVGRLTYNNAIGAWNLTPRFGWQHDVSGITPGPGGAFIDGRKAFSIGLQTDFQATWQLDISYTIYSGAGRYNLINDRDFIGGWVKYSF